MTPSRSIHTSEKWNGRRPDVTLALKRQRLHLLPVLRPFLTTFSGSSSGLIGLGGIIWCRLELIGINPGSSENLLMLAAAIEALTKLPQPDSLGPSVSSSRSLGRCGNRRVRRTVRHTPRVA